MIGAGNSYIWFPDHFKYKRIICIFPTEDIFCHITKEKHKNDRRENATSNNYYQNILYDHEQIVSPVILLSNFSFNFIIIEDFFFSGVFQQINQNTHYIDLSNIYGPIDLAANNLRTKTDGNLFLIFNVYEYHMF